MVLAVSDLIRIILQSQTPGFLTGYFACVSKFLWHWTIWWFPLMCHNKLIGDLNEMICLSVAFASKAMLNVSNFSIYSLLMHDESINFEAFTATSYTIFVVMEVLSVHTVRRNSYNSTSKIQRALYYADIDTIGSMWRLSQYWQTTIYPQHKQFVFKDSSWVYTQLFLIYSNLQLGLSLKGFVRLYLHKNSWEAESIRPCSYYCQRACLNNY